MELDDELQQRAFTRFLCEETKKQENMENIIAKALPDVKDEAKPEMIEDDWITNFFDKCRLISGDEMQIIWAHILSDETNNPGKYSKRTVNLVSTLDKSDAELFMNLCSYVWSINGRPVPLVLEVRDNIYKNNSITFDALNYLDTIGLIEFEPFPGYKLTNFSQKAILNYFGKNVNITFRNEANNELNIGHVMFSQIGYELYQIANATSIPEFFDTSIKHWNNQVLSLEISDENNLP